VNSPTNPQAKRHIGQILIDQGILTEDQLRIALLEQTKQHMPVGRLLVQLGFVSEATLRDALSEKLGLQSVDLGRIIVDPAALKTLKPSARLAPEPPQSSGTHASGNPASVSACQSGAFHAPFLSLLMVWASARSAKIFSAVSATMFSLSATAFPDIELARVKPRRSAGPPVRSFLALYDAEKP